jgi:hypothetical protein
MRPQLGIYVRNLAGLIVSFLKCDEGNISFYFTNVYSGKNRNMKYIYNINI